MNMGEIFSTTKYNAFNNSLFIRANTNCHTISTIKMVQSFRIYIYIFRMKFNIFQTMSNFPVLKPNVQFINQGINELICYIF